MNMEHRLARSNRDRMLLGVCGGVADWLGWDSTAVRVLTVVVTLMTAVLPAVIVYGLVAWAMPLGDEEPTGERAASAR
jgi:phage shock protein C